MSMDRGLKPRNALVRHRNVLSRDERIEALKEEEKWQDGRSVFGLPKVANRKVVLKKEKAAKAEEAPAEGVAGEGVAAEAAAEAPAAEKKPAGKGK